jgi:hypothetical protein
MTALESFAEGLWFSFARGFVIGQLLLGTYYSVTWSPSRSSGIWHP